MITRARNNTAHASSNDNGHGTGAPQVIAPVRCAIYTRKSTEEGLDQEFNSLDAQREAAEAYIASQRHEGWTGLPDRYDDDGSPAARSNGQRSSASCATPRPGASIASWYIKSIASRARCWTSRAWLTCSTAAA